MVTWTPTAHISCGREERGERRKLVQLEGVARQFWMVLQKVRTMRNLGQNEVHNQREKSMVRSAEGVTFRVSSNARIDADTEDTAFLDCAKAVMA